jgi:hypothetical protein
MVARWSANPLAILWAEMDDWFSWSGDGGDAPDVARRPAIIIAAG